MKRSEHLCATPGCGQPCPREYPFCAPCWRQVPKELRAPVTAELAKRETPALDRSRLYYAVSMASAAVSELTPEGRRVKQWEKAYVEAGHPNI